MSPILVRPVREQFEHDRVIRLLQARYRRKHVVAINTGADQHTGVISGTRTFYPDVVLSTPDRGHKVEIIVEVETSESVNHLEALSEWGQFGRLKTEFHLYVPTSMVDVARRLYTENGLGVHELWSYHQLGDQIRFTMVQRNKVDNRKGEKVTLKPYVPPPAPPVPPAVPVVEARIPAGKVVPVKPTATPVKPAAAVGAIAAARKPVAVKPALVPARAKPAAGLPAPPGPKAVAARPKPAAKARPVTGVTRSAAKQVPAAKPAARPTAGKAVKTPARPARRR